MYHKEIYEDVEVENDWDIIHKEDVPPDTTCVPLLDLV